MTNLDYVAQMVESGGNQDAMRFEIASFNARPEWMAKSIPKIMACNKCDNTTAWMIAATSWGMYQILGANLYAQEDFQDNIITYAFDIDLQLVAFTEFVAIKGFHPDEDVSQWTENRYEAYAAYYNGPGNVKNYVAAMKAYVK